MKQTKPLTKEQYLKKFSRAVRWRLPPRESEDAIADYRELVFQEERDESRLVEELGTPTQAAHLLTDVKTYRRWLAVFAVLVYGLFLLAKWAWMGHTPLYISGIGPRRYPVVTMAVGMVLSLYWFRRHGQKCGPLSKQLKLLLAAELVVGCGITYTIWRMMGLAMVTQDPSGAWNIGELVQMTVTAMMCIGVFSSLLGLLGLVQAKCRDRRWLALYILCITVAAMLGFVIFSMTQMDVKMYMTVEMFRANIFSRLLPVGAVGLIGTGVALC